MSKYRYYVSSTYDSTVFGTNDENIALESSNCDDYIVVDTETNESIYESKRTAVEER